MQSLKQILFIIAFSTGFYSHAQYEPEEIHFLYIVDQPPVTKGCETLESEDKQALSNCFLQSIIAQMEDKIKLPKASSDYAIEGKVYLEIVIDRSAQIKSVTIKRSMAHRYSKPEERNMANQWEQVIVQAAKELEIIKAAMLHEKSVAVKFYLPVTIK